jgi:hypothetical protein
MNNLSAGPNPELERAFRDGGAGAVPSQDAPVREANTGGRFATLGSSQPGKNNINQASFRSPIRLSRPVKQQKTRVAVEGTSERPGTLELLFV